jgi:hypothetical protein
MYLTIPASAVTEGGVRPARTGRTSLARDPEAGAVLSKLSRLVPRARRASATIIEIIPEGTFLTYGVGVSLVKMLSPAAARGRVEV